MHKAKTTRPHSFGGCRTCRKRHLKCDQNIPVCNRCERSKLQCDFAPALRWLVSTGVDAFDGVEPPQGRTASQHDRRHLYTESARRSMSAVMVRNMPCSVSAALENLDESSKELEKQRFGHRTTGPFGAFITGDPQPQQVVDDTPDVEIDSSGTYAIRHNDSLEAGTATSMLPPEGQINALFQSPDTGIGFPSTLDDLLTSSLDSMQWADLFEWDMDLLDPNVAPSQALQTDPPHGQDREDASVGHSYVGHGNAMMEPDVQWPRLDLIKEAPLLLKHFNEQVITQMGSLPINKKSAWRILNFPSAVYVHSQLTTLAVDRKDIKHASLANFYALIAVSALHLSLTPTNAINVSKLAQDWKDISERTYQAAKDHMRLSLETECSFPCKAKYKDQLMAIGAVLATALLSGNDDDGRKYLIEMERLIRYRGLTKPVISRRARLLHNVYAWMRIVSESTNVLHFEIRAADTAMFPMIASSLPDDSRTHDSSSDRTLDSFLYLEAYQMQPDRKHETPQASSEGQLDLHLTSPFVDRDGMTMQIYGVPETWLRLVSQTTRLANVLDKLDTAASKQDAETFALLQPKSTALETAVCAFRSRFSEATRQTSTTPHSQMVRALSGALVVFFYRRIRGIQPLMLQESVTQVIDSLHAFDAALQEHGMPGPGTAWPAFIAGAEAMSNIQRQNINTWLDKAHAKSGWKGYAMSRKVLAELWSQRDKADGSTTLPTWMGVCKQLRCWPLLC